MSPRTAAVERLRRARPVTTCTRERRASLALVIASWTTHEDWGWRTTFNERTSRNFARFRNEITPEPFQRPESEFSWSKLGAGFDEAMPERVVDSIWATLGLSIAAIVLAALLGGILSLLAARTPPPRSPSCPRPANRPRSFARGGADLRADAIRSDLSARDSRVRVGLPPQGDARTDGVAAVLALAFHNGGILGKLKCGSDREPRPAHATSPTRHGGSRLQIAATSIAPTALNRFLLYFFYRWETCVREATVLGMLGFVSLGWWITDGQVRMQYDRMVLYIVMGSVIILAGDLVSAGARRLIRQSS